MTGTPVASTPPGWYPDGSGRARWWDGSQWTEVHEDLAAQPDLEGTSPLAPITLTTSRGKIALLALGCLAFVVVSLFLLVQNPVVAVISLLFFGGLGGWTIVRLLRQRGSLVLENAGLRNVFGGTAPWRDIEYVGVGRIPGGPIGTKVIGVRLSSYDAFVASLTPAQWQLMQRFARASGYAGVALAVAAEADEGAELIGIPRDSAASMLAWSRQKSGFDLSWSPLLFAGDADRIAHRIETYRRAALAH